jgi:hypothetical protein
MEDIILGVVCALVIGIFLWSAEPGYNDAASPRAEDCYYNLLVQGFREGHLNVKRDAPPELASLTNPYDPAANKPYLWESGHVCHDMSYYDGKLYLYFGVAPALTLFWPYAIVTGHYLADRDAVVFFLTLAFLISAGLLHAIRRRYFPETGIWVIVSGLFVMGFATGALELLSSCDVYESAISCGFAFTMLAVAGIWKALHEPIRKTWWLLLASLAYGMAIASRPSLLFGAIILLLPAVQAWLRANDPGSRWRAALLLIPSVVPITFVGIGLMLYNDLRFANPLEFGWHYALTDIQDTTARQLSVDYVWFNFRFYFIGLMHWARHYPFLEAIPLLPMPSGYGATEMSYAGIY